jgi:hypothetical protein
MCNSAAAACNIVRNWGQRWAHLRKMLLQSLEVEEDARCPFGLTNGPDHPQSVTNAPATLCRWKGGPGFRLLEGWEF